MRDVLILGFILFMVSIAMARPFLMSIAYIYVDLVSPQRITYFLLSSVPFSLIMAVLAVLFFVIFDEKKGVRFGRLQVLMLIWVAWITFTTTISLFPEFAWDKWSSAWKSIGFAIFLPMVLRTRLRIETAFLFLVLCVGVITITGAIKTLGGGGGYGKLNLLVENNSGLYEGSTISTVAVATIPIILYLYRHTLLLPRGRLLFLATAGLIFSAVLIPVGTEARTGLICLGILGVLLFLKAKRKIMLTLLVGAAVVASVPFLPKSFTGRMGTIETHGSDESASTRVAVWKWTLDFVQDHPLGGGFDAYRANHFEYDIVDESGHNRHVEDRARAYHSSYFEVLGGHGYPGMLMYLGILFTAVFQMLGVARRQKKAPPEDAWIRDAALAVAQAVVLYMAGSAFVGIAFQTTLYLLVALAASLGQYVYNREAAVKAALPKPQPFRPFAAGRAHPA